MSTPARRDLSPGSSDFGLCALSSGRVLLMCAALLSGACAKPISHNPEPSADLWVDSVLSSLTPRERAAQLVWPQVFGDFTPYESAGWERVSGLIANERVGGFVMS